MMRMKPISDAANAALYFSKGDTSYYFDKDGLRREWGGDVAARLGLAGEPPTNEQLARLLHGYLPDGSNQPLTARIKGNRLCGWDLTGSVPKGVTVAAECGDTRVPDAIWRANRLAMADVQGYAVTRERVGGKQADRHTGSLLYYSTEHAETRPVEEKGLPADHPGQFMPDMDRHIHNVVLNCTFDAAENRLKALKIRPIFDLRRFFDRRFDHYLANILSEELGYEVKTTWRPNARGDVKYYSWDITGMPASVIAQNSRRSQNIADTEARIIAEKQARHPDAPDQLSPVARDQLGATSRLHKRDDLTLDACRAFWQGRISDGERDAIEATITRARERGNARPERSAEKAVEFAIRHHGERQSVTRWEQLLATAMERSMGGASPAEIEQEAMRQGAIVREMEGVKEATTRELQREERVIAGFAQAGIGSVRPVGVAAGLRRGRLNINPARKMVRQPGDLVVSG
jgi:conjugative relaxase-like TrwC/TraI family protein